MGSSICSKLEQKLFYRFLFRAGQLRIIAFEWIYLSDTDQVCVNLFSNLTSQNLDGKTFFLLLPLRLRDFHLQRRTARSAAVEAAVVIGPQRGSCQRPGLLGSQQDGIVSDRAWILSYTIIAGP